MFDISIKQQIQQSVYQFNCIEYLVSVMNKINIILLKFYVENFLLKNFNGGIWNMFYEILEKESS